MEVKREIILILGGARSGKSRFAQRLAAGLGEKVLYVAPLVPLDEEMRRRIELHQKARPGTWQTLEAATGVARAIRENIGDADVVILDCLTLLIGNLMSPSHDPAELEEIESESLEGELDAELERLLTLVEDFPVRFIIVSNEVGMGLVPPYPSGRAYRDLVGKANQFIAERANRVYLMIAGIPQELKALSREEER